MAADFAPTLLQHNKTSSSEIQSLIFTSFNHSDQAQPQDSYTNPALTKARVLHQSGPHQSGLTKAAHTKAALTKAGVLQQGDIMHNIINFLCLASASFAAAHVPFPLAERDIGQSCSISGESGTCQKTSDCTTQGYNEAGHCPGAADIQCCVKKSCSTSSGSGICMNTENKCGGSFIAGACPGDNTVKCCVKESSTKPPSGGSGQALLDAAEYWVPKNIPYVFGGGGCKGPSANGGSAVGFDCSGLTQYATCKSGHGTIPRTAQGQYHSSMGKHIPRAEATAGDMLFWGEGGDCVNNVAHVAIFVKPGVIVNAAHTGTNVREELFWHDGSGESVCDDAVRFW